MAEHSITVYTVGGTRHEGLVEDAELAAIEQTFAAMRRESQGVRVPGVLKLTGRRSTPLEIRTSFITAWRVEPAE